MKPVIVYGEGSAAVFLIHQILQSVVHTPGADAALLVAPQIIWVSGSGAKLKPIMPALTDHHALSVLGAYGIKKGIFHRVYRNKGFKLPLEKHSVKQTFWEPEQACLGEQEYLPQHTTLVATEQKIREQLLGDSRVKQIQAAPIVELEILDQGGKIQFANGFITEFDQFYFCDTLNELKGLPKLFTVLKHQVGSVKAAHLVSALQVVFTHSVPLNQTIQTGLMIPMNRDAGENFDRHVMGYFIEPTKSVWTVFLQPEEVEENHEIMKKLRKMKQALNKAFDSVDFLPEGKKEFMATVEKEQVHFEEAIFAMDGNFKESAANGDFVLLNDTFGISAALSKIAARFTLDEVSLDELDEDAPMGSLAFDVPFNTAPDLAQMPTEHLNDFNV